MSNTKNLAKAFSIFAKYDGGYNVHAEHDVIYVNIPIGNVFDFPEDILSYWDTEVISVDLSHNDFKEFEVEDIVALCECGFVYSFTDENWYVFV